MKLLIFSDSHGSEELLAKAVGDNLNADGYIFLGDGERDFEYALSLYSIYPYGDKTKEVYQVRGNCDMFSKERDSIVADICGHRIFITHGSSQAVKRGIERLALEASQIGCDVALFGHTHERFHGENQGVTLFNPGSLRSGSYGVLTLGNNRVELIWKNI